MPANRSPLPETGVSELPPQLLEQALGLTRRLLARLEQGELEGTDELEAARSRLLRQAFAADPPIDPARQIELLEAIQALDRKITGLAGQAASCAT